MVLMEPIIDFTECLKDSPRFRLVVEQNELDIDQLENRLNNLVKLCNVMVDIGKQFVKSKSNFISGIYDLLVYFNEDKTLVSCLDRMSRTLTELLKYDNILIDQANRAVGKNLSNFIKEDIHKTKETKKHFDKISDELDNVLTRHSQVQKNKIHECEEVNNLLTATRSCFQHTALDYTSQLSVFQSKKRYEILDSLLSLLNAYGTYFHQGSELFQDIDSFKKEVGSNVQKMREEIGTLERELVKTKDRYNVVNAKDIIPTLIKGDHVRLEGYLNKRTSNAFKAWHRRWFIIQDHQLVYQKRTHEKDVTIMEEDLRLCTARPVVDFERRFCFEVISPSKSHMLQADSEEACQQWVTAMQAGTNAAYNDNAHCNEMEGHMSYDSQESCNINSSTASSKSSLSSLNTSSSNNNFPPAKPARTTASASNYLKIIAIPGNENCCDCRSPEPKWASINLGITLCIECSGIHRSLGVHMSKVRSLTLDSWDPELVKVMLSLGNDIVNEIYEAKVDETIAKRAEPDSSRAIRESWIRAKYVDKKFVDRNGLINKSINHQENSQQIQSKKKDQHISDHNINVNSNTNEIIDCNFECDNFYNELLFKGAENCDIKLVCEALAKGAQINWINGKQDNRTALHQAILTESVVACEFLLLNGAKCNLSDSNGKTPLHLATEFGNTGQVCLLLKRGADQTVKDLNGNDALTIAINNANADIVTLLRLAKLNEEMKNDEFGNPNDETFNEVVRDFSQLASHSPEKLKRTNLSQNDEEFF